MNRIGKGLIIGSVSVALLSTLFLNYNKSNQVLINSEFLEKNDKIAIYIKNESGVYEKTNIIPTSGYTLNTSESKCNNNATPSWNTTTNNLKITNLSKANTSCYLYFDKDKPASEKLAISLVGAENISDARSGEITVDTEMNNGKLYSVADDYGTSYVYAGTAPNNWVSFAGFYWRIIRINGDGTIRLIYNGTSVPATTGEETQIGTKAFNTNHDDNAYVGYMYGTPENTDYTATHANTNNSTILGASDGSEEGSLNWWYKNNIANNTTYTSKVDINGVFCNDRKVQLAGSEFTGDGTGTTHTSYAPYARLFSGYNSKSSQTPSLKCTQANDIFSASSATRGNKKLTYPVGLITSDEVVLAGGFGDTNRAFWMKTGKVYWTMSPFDRDSSNTVVFLVNANGLISGTSVHVSLGVRPVINLRSDVKLTGSGTTDSPYVIEGAE